MNTVWILINGTGEDGNECSIDSIYSTERKAINAFEKMTGKKYDRDGDNGLMTNYFIECWAVT